jgi:dethiobiotin synthase
MQGFFVTGTDTGIGKSVVAAWLVRKLDGEYWKPVQSGLEDESDTALVQRLSGLPAQRFHAPGYELTAPLSPHESARLDGITIQLGAFRVPVPDPQHPLIVEGAGGLMVPLNDTGFMIDLIRIVALPVILVARTTLGTINHTLLSLEALRSRGLPVAGVILHGPVDCTYRQANREAIIRYGHVGVIADVPWIDPLTPSALAAAVSLPFSPSV